MNRAGEGSPLGPEPAKGDREMAGKKIKLEQLAGKVVAFAHIIQGAPTIVFTDGTAVEVWSDAEGNGPGHAEIYKIKE